MMEDDSSTSYIISASHLTDVDNDEDNSIDVSDENKCDIMPILTEVVSDISQLTHTSGEDEKILVFKSEPSMCSEMGGLEMDHFEAVTEVEMGSVNMIKTEEVDGDESTHEDTVAVPFQQIAPQQFIILTRTSDGSSGRLFSFISLFIHLVLFYKIVLVQQAKKNILALCSISKFQAVSA